MTQGRSRSEDEEAAAQWAVMLEDGPLDQQAEARFEEWLSRDSRRFGAFVRARALLVYTRRRLKPEAGDGRTRKDIGRASNG